MFGFIAILVALVAMVDCDNNFSYDKKHFGTLQEIINGILTEKGLDNVAALLNQQGHEIEALNQALFEKDQEIKLLNQAMLKQEKDIKSLNESFSKQEQEIKTLNQAVTQLHVTNKNYERKVETLSSELSTMSKTMMVKDKEIDRIENELAKMEKVIEKCERAEYVKDKLAIKGKSCDEKLITRNGSGHKFLSTLTDKNKNHQAREKSTGEFTQDEKETTSSAKNLSVRRTTGTTSRAVGSGIAFSAYVSKLIPHLVAGHVIKCDHVIFNDGNNYNPLTGIFTVSEPGVYLLTFTIATDALAHWIWVKLVVDNREILKVATDAQYDVHVEMGSNTAILRLNQGESVWIEVAKSNDSSLWAVTPTTTFSGVLLYA